MQLHCLCAACNIWNLLKKGGLIHPDLQMESKAKEGTICKFLIFPYKVTLWLSGRKPLTQGVAFQFLSTMVQMLVPTPTSQLFAHVHFIKKRGEKFSVYWY